ncbi:MAG: glycosyltransferase family 39 protein [Candidatus Omnitrophota bacterium]
MIHHVILEQTPHNFRFILFIKNICAVFFLKKAPQDIIHPPLYFYIMSYFFYPGIDKNILPLGNMLFFAILIFSTYGIGKYLSGSQEAGVLAAVLVSFFPSVTGLSRVLRVEFALAAFVALTFYLMLRICAYKGYKAWIFSVLAGLAIGLGALTKSAFFIFFCSMIIYFIFTRKEYFKNKNILPWVFSIILGLFISSSWYFRKELLDLKTYAYYINVNMHNDLLFYLVKLNKQLSPIVFLSSCLALFIYVKEKKKGILLFILISILIFSIAPNKEERYIVPILPLIAVMVADVIWRKYNRWKYAIIIYLVVIIAQNLFISYSGLIVPNFLSRLPRVFFPYHEVYSYDSNIGIYAILKIRTLETEIKEVLTIAKKESLKNNVVRRVDIMCFTKGSFWCDMVYIINRDDYNVNVHFPMGDLDYFSYPPKSDFEKQIEHYDFIIMQDTWINGETCYHAKKLLPILQKQKANFILLKKITLSEKDGILDIYKKLNLVNEDHIWEWGY